MSKPYSESTAELIDVEVRTLVDHAKERTVQLLTEVRIRCRSVRRIHPCC
jgi:ATP-dependent Zn protease